VQCGRIKSERIENAAVREAAGCNAAVIDSAAARSCPRPGHYADLAVLSDEYFSVPEDRIKEIESMLIVTGR
jgi:hypothetical protein